MNARRPSILTTLASSLALLALAGAATGDPAFREGEESPSTGIAAMSLPRARIADARIKEGDSGLAHLTFTVRLSGPFEGQATLDFTTDDGTATVADSDYVATDGTLVFSPTDTLRTIDVAVPGDLRLEGNEWLLVRLSHPRRIVLADSEAVGTIVNDERARFTHSLVGQTDYTYGTLSTAWGDCNDDGDEDIPLFAGGPGESFSEISGFRALLAQGNYHGSSWCDYDRDGDLDLVILGYWLGAWVESPSSASSTAPPTPDRLLQNQGNGTFIDVAPALGMDVAGNAETAVWGDFDGDGWPDLFAPFYGHVFPFHSFLYHNNGDGTFTDVAGEAGVSLARIPANLRPEGAAAADWNDDGRLDFYCASHLYINDGTGHFTDVREAVGLPVMFDEGANFVDYDNDGDLDLYVRGAYWPMNTPHLFRNDAGHFTDATVQAGIGNVSFNDGDSWVDVDNDGDLDLLQCQAAGPARLMLNQGDGTFERDPDFELVSSTAGLSAWGDADGDGDPDVVFGGRGKELLVNRLDLTPGFSGSHLRVCVLDADGYETAHGATVRLRQLGGGPGTTQTRVVDGGSGYLGQNEYTVQFGGVGSGRYALEVVYPSPAGSRVVVDSLVNPLLGSIEPGRLTNPKFTVYENGRVAITGRPAAGASPPRPQAGSGHLMGTPPPSPATSVHRLGTPWPIPARRSISIPVGTDGSARVALGIHDLSGRLLRKLDTGAMRVGRHSVEWDLRDDRGAMVPTGVYFCQLLVDGRPADMRRLLVVR